jgi:hypothetical protein
MSRAARIQLAIGVILVIAGILFAALPKDWMEESLGVEPDGGNGFVELLLFVVPVVVGVILIARVLLARRRSSGVAAPPASGSRL